MKPSRPHPWSARLSNDVAHGTVLIVASSLAYSLAGFFTRLIPLDVWTVLFWRGVFAGLFIGAIVIWRHGRRTGKAVRRLGLPGIAVTVLSALATICFINAMRLITVAEVMTIAAATPFAAAGLGRLVAGEREDLVTLWCSTAAFIGVMIIFDPRASVDHVAGYGLAAAMVAALASMMVIIRHRRETSMLPATWLSTVLCAVLVLPLASPAAPTAGQFVLLALFGTVQFGLGLLMLTIGTRMISATRSALVGSIETPLAPLWVWLAFSEQPTTATWFGGTLVMLAVVVDVLARRPPQAHSAG